MEQCAALHVLLVASASVHDDSTEQLANTIHAGGIRLDRADEHEAAGLVRNKLSAHQSLDIILIGPSVANPLVTARRLRLAWPIGHLLFVPAPAQRERLRLQLRHAPMIGQNWSLAEANSPDLLRQLLHVARGARQRMRLRTTLDRANLRLSSARLPADGLEYRRLVVSEHYLANLLAQSKDAILSMDNSNTVLFCSAGAEQLLGLKNPASAQGMPGSLLPFWSAELEAKLTEVRRTAESLVLETACRTQDSPTDLELSISPVLDETHQCLGTLLTVRDISETRRVLEAERFARLEAERIGRLKDEFLAMLSHELRTPLSAIIGRTQLLQMRYDQDPTLAASLSIIERNAHLQAKLIEDLLDVSAIIAGKLQLDKQLIDIPQLVEASVESVRRQAEAKQIGLTLHMPVALATVAGDPHRLQQVLLNLLVNALKFTPEGGKVDVWTRTTEDTVEITVSDTGIGIDPTFLPAIFNRFGQEDATITRRHGGLGLGLSIARQLVELHGGTIQAASAGRDLGARFTVLLPTRQVLCEPQIGPQETVDLFEVTQHRFDGLRVLVVDDSVDARQIVTDILQALGASVRAVESGTLALSALGTFRPNLLVSDIGMPGMDGYQLMRTIRTIGWDRERLPALALSAFAGIENRDAALAAGYQAHLSKPIHIGAFVTALARLNASSPHSGRSE